jgi:peptide/nickel transport system substrate-binding protein
VGVYIAGRLKKFIRAPYNRIFQEEKGMKRISFAFIAVLLITAQAVFAGGGQAGTATGGGGSASSGKYKQAPSLNGQNLPSVDQRLPTNPLVVKPWEKVGKYGGTMRIVTTNDHKERAMTYTTGYEGRSLVIWSMDQKEVVPNVAESYSLSADGRDYTFVLRRGLKWSNGTPFTSEDIRFWYQDVETNADLNPTANLKYTVEIKDEYTVIFHYKDPSPLEIYTFANYSWATTAWFLPQEYLKQFHIKYNSNAETQAKAEGYQTWKDNFNQKRNYVANSDLPTLCPFVLITKDVNASTLVLERNPYFWAVDTDGNQLPYIDRLQIAVAESMDVVKMRAVAGEVDLGLAVIQENFLDYPLYMEHARAGNYTVRTGDYAEPNAMNIHINKTHQDPAKRDVMGRLEFRQALSLALDRNTIISTNYSVGPVKAVPRNFAPYPGSPYKDDDLANNYARFDLNAANQLLDSIGLNRKNSAGKRLLSNGAAFTLVIDVPNYSPDWIDIGNQIAACWQAAGIDVTARSIDPSLWGQRTLSNDFDVSIMTGGGGFLFPSPGEINSYTGYNNIDWPTTFQNGHLIYKQTKGESGIAPDADIQKLWELGTAAVVEPNNARRDTMLKEIFALHKKNLYILGIGTRLPYPYIVKNNLHNVAPLNNDWGMGHGGHARSSQYYLD